VHGLRSWCQKKPTGVQAIPDEHLRKKRTGYLFTLFPLRSDYVTHGKRVQRRGIMPCHRDEYNPAEHLFSAHSSRLHH
jgi:hypothetical protein